MVTISYAEIINELKLTIKSFNCADIPANQCSPITVSSDEGNDTLISLYSKYLERVHITAIMGFMLNKVVGYDCRVLLVKG